MADQAEQAFTKTFLNTLSTQPIAYPDDYQQTPENSLRKLPILQVAVPPAPQRKVESSVSSVGPASISITFKSSKPAASFTLSVQSTDSISSIKSQLAADPTAPPADAQRLLLKGKALADAKLLKEYNVKDGDTVNLMVKPGFAWDATVKTPSPVSLSAPVPTQAQAPRKTGGHQRIPSVILSPSPSNEDTALPQDIMLTLDTTEIAASLSSEAVSAYQSKVANPEFWQRLYSFLRSEFTSDNDALHAFEDFLRASKGMLTASNVALIRDTVGVVGMSGT